MHWLSAHWLEMALVLTAILPTIITGLRDYPQAQHWLNVLLDVLSLVTHRDSQGSLKIPGKRSIPPGELALPKMPPPLPPAAVLLPLILALGLSACCTFSRTGCPKDSFAACATQAVKEQLPHLLPAIAGIFMHSSFDVDVQAELAKQGISVGGDVLWCAVKRYFDQSGDALARLKSGNFGANRDAYLNVPAHELAHGHINADQWLRNHRGAK